METILLVDDVKDNIDILMEVFKEEYTVRVAMDGPSALRAVERQAPDIILLDIMMPEMNGFEVCTRLKENEATRDIPVIFVTALNVENDEAQGLQMGAVDYITKPVSIPIVKARIRNHLDLCQARKQLKQQNEKLKNLLQLREDMAYMAVHDMRTPLGTILGFCELLNIKKYIMAEGEKYLGNICKAANRLNALITDMLVLARTEKEKLVPDLSMVSVRELINNAEMFFSASIKSKKINLSIQIPQEDYQARVDNKLFQRVLDNLLSNALKFSPSNTTIELKVEYLESEQHNLRFSIKDEGPGIPEQEKEKIFDKFAIVDLKRKGIPQIGLGLAFCKTVVEAHNGKIFTLKNKPKGTVFVVEI